MSNTISVTFRVDKKLKENGNIPNDETLSSFKWTEDYIRDGKKSGFKTTDELFNHLGI
ncbi:MAG: hypothetical protein FWF51_02485 [Chitinivibrionia bacterium]|nr:hypothetical protein [Chitinivibrionia bacterium]